MEYIVLLISLTLFQIPMITPGGTATGTLVRLVVLLPFWLVVFRKLMVTPALSSSGRLVFHSGIKYVRDHLRVFSCLAMFVMLLGLSIIRATAVGTMSLTEGGEQLVVWATMVGFAASVFIWSNPRGTGFDRTKAIYYALGIFVAVNVGLQISGIVPPVQSELTRGSTARMLGWFGFDVERQTFPLGSGINGFGAAAGAAVVGSMVFLVRWARGTRERLAGMFFMAAGLYAIFATDSRASLVWAVGCGLLGVLLPIRAMAQMRWAAVVAPVLPLVLLALATRYADVLVDVGFARSGSDMFTAGQRLFVWGAVANELQSYSHQHLTGFGFFGQTASGVVYSFGHIVGGGYVESRLSAHNALLQTILDVGYFGAAVFLCLYWFGLRMATRRGTPSEDPKIRFLAASMIYLLLAGTTEVIPTPYQRETYVLFLLLLMAAVGPTANSPSGGGTSRKRADQMADNSANLHLTA